MFVHNAIIGMSEGSLVAAGAVDRPSRVADRVVAAVEKVGEHQRRVCCVQPPQERVA